MRVSGLWRRGVCMALLVSVVGFSAVPVMAATPDLREEALIKSARGKVVLLDFWASWCAPCRKSFPWMNAMQKKYGDQGFTVIAVNLDMEKELAAQFLKQTPAQFRLEYDPKGDLATKLNVEAMPSSFLLDRKGNIVQQHAGFREAQLDTREQEIKKLLQE